MAATINNDVLNKARECIYEFAGIHLPENKDSTIKNRLDKLVRDLDISDFESFFASLRRGLYRQDFINAFTTNKTDFFREGFHFKDMVDRILPQRMQDSTPLKVLCAASSTGEEPYSIASTLLFSKEIYGSRTPLSIQAIDVDTSVLEFAKAGEYIVDTKLNPLPTWIDLNEYFFITQKNEREVYMNARSNIKNLISFKQQNLCAHSYPFGVKEFDIIFCRNVLIYFKVLDQEKILKRLFSHLKIGGTLYLGHSESILNLASKVDRLGQNIFIKAAD